MIVVWFSCGAASAAAAKITIEKYGARHEVRVVNNPIAEEDEDNRRFLRDVERWLGCPIETATNSRWPEASCEQLWSARRYMAGVRGAICTEQLKKQARVEWETQHRPDWHVLGFTLEERKRHENFVLAERSNVIPVLIDEHMTKQDCLDFVAYNEIELPRVYALGYPNANCIGCVKAQSPTYWNHVRKMHPDVFARRATLSREIGAKLVRVKGERMFLDELDSDAIGDPMKSMHVECGIFCEERL